ncbi:putative 26S proteasome non-ATPase regulatory subunit 7 protein [Corchorus olitorius]|uniref:26S proteasome non-ATPase regulatory subunit 7 protein n=1 Tax=Corchorus olitorius TaxID=93759 RepID=A0A1R3KZJ8_9ROSI|nr:putative 26S proteasome non-ATPase regulatory subunit 7 protein [Corchorus olitorius]
MSTRCLLSHDHHPNPKQILIQIEEERNGIPLHAFAAVKFSTSLTRNGVWEFDKDSEPETLIPSSILAHKLRAGEPIVDGSPFLLTSSVFESIGA